MTTQTLSVVMPNFNHARYLPESLGAVAAQSVPPLELIVVDDASTDDSVAVIEEFIRRHPFARLVRQPRNQGLGAAINRGLESAQGDYVIFPGADDRLLPGIFEKSLALLARHPQAGLCSALARLLGPCGENLGPYRSPIVSREPCYLSAGQARAAFVRHGSWFVTHSCVFRRAAVVELGGWDPDLGWAGDGLLIGAIAARHGACFIPEDLACWRKLDDSLSMRGALDAAGTWRLVERQAAKMASLRYRDCFPEDYMKVWWRQTLTAIIWETRRRRPYGHAEVSYAVRRMPSPDWTDRALLAALKHRELGWWATRLYLFLHQPAVQRSRIIREKIGGLIGLGGRGP